MTADNHNEHGWGKPFYKVGYGKPPTHAQFKKGQSGNPKGRKPRIKNASTLLSIELDKLIVVSDGEREIQITKREAFITSLVNDGIKNKPHARALLLKLMDVSPPPEPFVPNDEDDAAVEEFLNRARERGKGGWNSGGDDGDQPA